MKYMDCLYVLSFQIEKEVMRCFIQEIKKHYHSSEQKSILLTLSKYNFVLEIYTSLEKCGQ